MRGHPNVARKRMSGQIRSILAIARDGFCKYGVVNLKRNLVLAVRA